MLCLESVLLFVPGLSRRQKGHTVFQTSGTPLSDADCCTSKGEALSTGAESGLLQSQEVL